ncbi:hypothetical protein GCM10027427_34100 [Pseudoclavibacter terrae]
MRSLHSGQMDIKRAAQWNSNIHYHHLILDALPPNAQTALDVGTGNGLLAAELHQRVPAVIGLDPDAEALESAHGEDHDVTWIHDDVLTYPLPLASFDVVTSIATIHHLPNLDQTFSRFAELAAPGGMVAVVGLAR